MIHVLYDATKMCGNGCDCGCPKVEFNDQTGEVEIFHPDQSEKGRIKMTPEEFNEMIHNARVVTTK